MDKLINLQAKKQAFTNKIDSTLNLGNVAVMLNSKRMTFLLMATAAFLIALVTACIPASPAFAKIPIIDDVASWAADLANDNFLSPMLRSGANVMLSLVGNQLNQVTAGDMLTRNFDNLIPSIQPILYNIHQNAAIPIANIVLCIFLVVGLCKAISHMGQAETGINIMELLMVFCVFALVKSCIDSSFAWMKFGYDICRWLIVLTQRNANLSGDGSGTQISAIPDDMGNCGVLCAIIIVSVLMLIVAFIIVAIAQVTVIVRSIQIYVYTAFAALPLAFFVSESSRSIATGFLKRYVALLFSGAILVLLFCCMSAINGISLTSFATSVDWHTAEGSTNAISNIFFSIIPYIAFAFCIVKSGAWAREFVGI